MLREMRVDFEHSQSVCVWWRREGGWGREGRDGAETELGQRPLCLHPSWWLLCASELSWCCVITSIMPVASHNTHYLSPRCARSYAHTCTCTNWVFWQTQRKQRRGLNKGCCDRLLWNCSHILCVLSDCCRLCGLFDARMRICSHHRAEWAELDGGFRGGVQEEQGRGPHPPLAGVWQRDGPGSLLPRYQNKKVPSLFYLHKRPDGFICVLCVCSPPY